MTSYDLHTLKINYIVDFNKISSKLETCAFTTCLKMFRRKHASSRMSIFLQVLGTGVNSWMTVGSVTQEKDVIQIEVSFCATPLVAPNGTTH